MADLDALKDIPGYKAILKSVLKSQIQMLTEQLSTQTGEETIILTASVHDGTLSHLGSSTGKGFLEGRDEIKSQFLGYCLKTHHKAKTAETNKSPYQRPSPRPRSPILQQQPIMKRQKVHPVALISRHPQAEYPLQPRPMQRQPSLPEMNSGSNNSSEHVLVKQEVRDSQDNENEHTDTYGGDDSFSSSSTPLPSSLQLSHTQTSGDHGNADTSDLDQSGARDAEDSSDKVSSIKIEPITENEMELEITGVEMGDGSMGGAESWGQGQGQMGYSSEESFNQGAADQSGYSELVKMEGNQITGQNMPPMVLQRTVDHTDTPAKISLPCPDCGKIYPSQDRLDRHLRKTCRQGYYYKCRECGKVFRHSSSLSRHVRMMHRNNRKIFRQKADSISGDNGIVSKQQAFSMSADNQIVSKQQAFSMSADNQFVSKQQAFSMSADNQIVSKQQTFSMSADNQFVSKQQAFSISADNQFVSKQQAFLMSADNQFVSKQQAYSISADNQFVIKQEAFPMSEDNGLVNNQQAYSISEDINQVTVTVMPSWVFKPTM